MANREKATDMPTLEERLRETEWSRKSDGFPCHPGTTCWLRNPDGPEAADRIAVLTRALQTIRDEPPVSFDGHNAMRIIRLVEIANVALTEIGQ